LTVIATRQPAAEEFDATVPYPVVRVAAGDLAGVAMRMSAAAVELSPRPDALVATKWSPDGVAAVLACRRLRLPYLVMGYGREFIQTGGNLMKWAVQRTVIRRAAGALVISRYTQRLMQRRGLPPRRVKVIYAGVSAGDYAAGAAGVAQLKSQLGITDEKVILTVSRLVPRKGQEQVMRALVRLRDDVPRLRYLVVGDGPRRPELEALARQLQLDDTVIFTGQVPRSLLPTYYHLCDVFVMTSRDLPGEPIEGFGLTYLEAGACGKPVIGGRTGGVEDAVEHGVNGLLVDPERPEEIAEALVQVLTDDQLARRLGEQGRRRIEQQFTWDHVAERFQHALVEFGIGADKRRSS